MTKEKSDSGKIKISEAKGRPMLRWVGKQPLDYVKGFPAQLVEVFDPEKKNGTIQSIKHDELKDNWHNLLFHGDNKEVLATLLENGYRGKVDLIYIDPPFDSNADYIRKVELRGIRQNKKLEAEPYTLGEQIQYTDIWANDNYLQFMYERLLLLKELLNEDGFIFLHCDYHQGHYLKVLMDEVFGRDSFRNEIVVRRVQKNFIEGETIRSMNNAYDVILLYSKSDKPKFLPPRTKDNGIKKDKGENWHGFDAPNWSGNRPNLSYALFGVWPPAGSVWRWTKERAEQAIKDGILRKNPKTGKPEYLVTNDKGEMVNNLWADLVAYQFSEDYPTEKSEKLLARIVEICSIGGSLILDCFIGSGTTCAVAQKLGRRWIGCDINKGAIQTTSKRLQQIILEQLEDGRNARKQEKLNGEKLGYYPYSFGVYRVNDYDLQLLRTEAMQLAVDHVGIQRIKTDSFFDGLLGKNLVKIIEFNHPLTLLDLQLLQDELKKRPDENRNITLVCLGKETSADPWIADYNKKHPVNKLEVIELRTDPKYGKFLIYQPISAKVSIERKKDKAIIKILDFVSPSIIERLKSSETFVKTKISDFRSMIDVILIDANYDGKTFRIQYSDVPEKKTDLVKGEYEIEVLDKKTTIAVKIIDMLGEEMIMSKEA